VEASRDKVYWQIYDPTEVVDWSIDSRGGLQWIMVEREEYSNADPRAEAQTQKVRYLYEPGKYTRMVFNEWQEDFTAIQEAAVGFNGIPFTLVGIPSSLPWWFDDVERIQRSILDLHSSLDTSIFKSIFPGLVIAQGFADQLRSDKIDAAVARRKIGTGNPITETNEENGITRYLTGSSVDLKFIREEISARQRDLYDIVGLAMKTPESRQVASAESKQWDHLDTEAVLAERAVVLEEAEMRCIELSQQIGGPIFTPYTPSYSRKFDLTDFVSDIQAITQATGLSMPPEADKMLVKAALRSAAKRFNIPGAESESVLKAVDAYEPPVPTFTPPGAAEDDGDGGGGEE
jgi:hypothetical protein